MKEAYAKASNLASKNASRGKRQYDKKVRSTVLQAGDRVLVRNLTPRGGPGKLRSFWEDEVHIVQKRKGQDSPVYDVISESKKKTRTLHRNMLLPCDYLACESTTTATRKQGGQRQQQSQARSGGDNLSEEEEEEEEEFPSVSLQVHVQPASNITDDGEDEPDVVENEENMNSEQAENEENVDGEQVENEVNGNDDHDDVDRIDGQLEDAGDVQDEDEEIPDGQEAEAPTLENGPVPGNVPIPVPPQFVLHDPPPRNRQAPQRLTYYEPGNPACFHCGAVIVPFNPQQIQNPYHQRVSQRRPSPYPNQQLPQFVQHPQFPNHELYQFPYHQPSQFPYLQQFPYHQLSQFPYYTQELQPYETPIPPWNYNHPVFPVPR